MFSRFTVLLLAFSLTVIAQTTPADAAQPLKVLTSIKPLALIIDEAFGDLVEVNALLPANVSPHSYALKPSDIRQLSDTELFVWMGPGMEAFLPKMLKKAPPRQTLTLMEAFALHAPQLLLRYQAFGKEEEDHAGEHASHEEEDHADHTPGHIDLHLWLGRQQALEIARLVGESLKALRPDATTDIDRRVAAFEYAVGTLPPAFALEGTQLVSHHNGFAYLMADLNLTIKEVVVTQTDLTPGAQHFGELRDAFQHSPHCLIIEPQFGKSRIVDKLAALATHTVTLDSMGQHAESYTQLYQSWTDALKGCSS